MNIILYWDSAILQAFDNHPSLLIAMPQMEDPNFERAVLLLAEHNTEGALGFIINRPCEIKLHDIIFLEKDLNVKSEINVWFGGPVDTNSGIILEHTPRKASSNTNHQTYALGSSEQALKNLVSFYNSHPNLDSQDVQRFRFLVGYAGWEAGQLEDELRQGAWLQVPFSEHVVFETPWDRMWEVAFNSVGASPEKLAGVNHIYLH